MADAQQQVELAKQPKKMIKRKPARKQVEQGQVEKKQPEQTGQTWNVWYHKWAGGDKYDSYNAKEKSQTRVDIAKDSGYTRADAAGTPYCCLFFARGCCPYGSECSFLHRLPQPEKALPDNSRDVFGREKHAGYRDDMGGVGSFGRINRTLYIGRVTETRSTEEVVERHFEEFGDIDRLRVLSGRNVAFVTYVSEVSAQFAKEAMMHQSLDNDEVLNVRWATEDPNPVAKVREKRRLEDLGTEGIAARLDPEFVQAVRQQDELEGRLVTSRGEEDEGDDDDNNEEAQPRQGKKARIEAPPASSSAAAPTAATTTTKAAATHVTKAPAPLASGLLSSHALDSLKLAANMRGSSNAASAPVLKVGIEASKPATATGLGGLADYGSDSD